MLRMRGLVVGCGGDRLNSTMGWASREKGGVEEIEREGRGTKRIEERDIHGAGRRRRICSLR